MDGEGKVVVALTFTDLVLLANSIGNADEEVSRKGGFSAYFDMTWEQARELHTVLGKILYLGKLTNPERWVPYDFRER